MKKAFVKLLSIILTIIMMLDIAPLVPLISAIQGKELIEKVNENAGIQPETTSAKTGDDGTTNWDFIEPVTHLINVPDGFTAICTAQELSDVRNNLSGNYILMNNIDLSSWQNWEPIGDGSADNLFKGIFDGNGYIIKNLTVHIDISETIYAGLFGKTYENSTIKNVGICGAEIEVISKDEHSYTGGIAGYSSSSISNCFNKATVNASSSSPGMAGGIAGYSSGVINNCYNMGKVCLTCSSSSDAGGIVGVSIAPSTISNCYNKGAVSATSSAADTDASFVDAHVGGIVGSTNTLTISNCYNTGTVSVTSSYNAYSGGITGWACYSTISNCYNTGTVSSALASFSPYAASSGVAGGIAGRDSFLTINNCYNTGTVSASTPYISYAGGIAGSTDTRKSGYSISDCYNTGDVRASSFSDFETYAGGIMGHSYASITISNCYNTGAVSASSFSDDAYAGGIAGWADSSTISNCYNTGTVYAPSSYNANVGGVAGCANSSTISNCYNTGTVNATYSYTREGGIVGCANSSTISNCCNTGDVSATSAYDTSAGGIAGYAHHISSLITIINCYNTGDVSATSSHYYSDWRARAGGIIGYIDSYSLIKGSTINNCYNTGEVSATSSYSPYNDFEGGIVGDVHDNAELTNCYYRNNNNTFCGDDCDTHLLLTNVKALTTAQMKQQMSYVGFDFTAVWTIDSDTNKGYPTLQALPHIPEAELSLITLNQTKLDMTYNSTAKLTATVTPSGTAVTWSSSNPNVAKVVDQSGNIKAFGRGTATITATTEDGQSATCEIVVDYSFFQWLIVVFLFGWIWY